MSELVPCDEPVFTVVPDQDHDRRPNPKRSLDLLRVHEKARISGYRDGCTVRKHELRGDRTRHPDSHRGEAVGDDARIRPFSLEHPRHPHLVGADITDHHILGLENLPQVPDDLLRFHGERGVRGVLSQLVDDHLSEVGGQEFLPRLRLPCNTL